jgi:hypothetical protein
VYLQKITKHNEPFMPALTKASIYISVHYRNGIHVSSRYMDSVQPQIRSFLNEADPCLAYSQCGTSMSCKTWRDTDVTVGSLWISVWGTWPSEAFPHGRPGSPTSNHLYEGASVCAMKI